MAWKTELPTARTYWRRGERERGEEGGMRESGREGGQERTFPTKPYAARSLTQLSPLCLLVLRLGEPSTTQVITPRPPQPKDSCSQIIRPNQIRRSLGKTNKIPDQIGYICISKQTVHCGNLLDHSV